MTWPAAGSPARHWGDEAVDFALASELAVYLEGRGPHQNP